MVRIDDERGKEGSSSSILSILGFMMVRSDAWNKKNGGSCINLGNGVDA
ncbi:hypothetical protein [Mogibacterium sp.]|nr:hypothetical protein [Mogibacterium sp.]MBN2935035.1 hypothetical protein [Mogibacterium sp.]